MRVNEYTLGRSESKRGRRGRGVSMVGGVGWSEVVQSEGRRV